MDKNMQYLHQESDTLVIDLKRIYKELLRNLWKIAIITMLCGSIFLFYSYQFITPTYSSTASFYVNNKVQLNGVQTNITSNDHTASKDLVSSYIAILYERDTLIEVCERSQLNVSPSYVLGMISTTHIKDTEVFRVTVSSANPTEVTPIANAITHVVTNKISGIIEGSSVKVINYPVVPTAPNSPNHIKNTALGMLVGLVISAGIVILVQIFDTKIKSEETLLHYSKHPILSIVPDMNAATKRGYYKKYYGNHYGYYATSNANKLPAGSPPCLIGKNIDFATTEAYKLLRTKIQYSLTSNQNSQIFVVTSAMAGEGKSISSINLAYSLAQLGKRVLLIDGDMRRPSLATKLSLSNYPGLSEYLTGFIGIEDLVQEFNDDGEYPLKVLTAGSIPPNPVELIDSSRMADLIAQLRNQYDYIVIDMPPVGDVSDALVASKFADGVLLIVRHNYCTRSALCDAIHQFEFINAKILGVVLNSMGDQPVKYKGYKHAKNYNPPYAYAPRAATPPKTLEQPIEPNELADIHLNINEIVNPTDNATISADEAQL